MALPALPEETARLRVAEQQAACAVVGVKHLTVLEHPDGVLVYGLDLRRDICREIRRFKPDVVLGTGYDDVPARGVRFEALVVEDRRGGRGRGRFDGDFSTRRPTGCGSPATTARTCATTSTATARSRTCRPRTTAP